MASNITVPTGMSRTDALEGLWRCSAPARFFDTIPNGDEIRRKQEAAAWESRAKVEDTVLKAPYVDYFGGRCIKTDMKQFPQLDLTSYKKSCEIGMSFEEIFKRCLRK